MIELGYVTQYDLLWQCVGCRTINHRPVDRAEGQFWACLCTTCHLPFEVLGRTQVPL